MKRSRFGLQWVACAGALIMAGTAFAGAVVQQNVQIIGALRFATGRVGWVHNTADSTQFIGCTSSAGLGLSSMAVCFAHDLAGTHASCTTSDPELVATVRSLRPDSNLSFIWQVDAADPNKLFCLSISVENGSDSPQKR